MNVLRLHLLGIGSFLLFSALRSSTGLLEDGLIRFEDSRISMACTHTVVVYGYEAQALPRVVDAVLDEVDRIDRLMSHYKADSPLSVINREAANGPVTVEPELFKFIEECVKYSRESRGAFDIT